MLTTPNLRISSVSAVVALLAATSLRADPTTYRYDGDTLPTQGAYGSWFTTIGPNSSGISYFGGTSWTSDGDILTMGNTATNLGIWFGRGEGYGDSPGISLADTASGNWAQARLALVGGGGSPANEWSMYWYDGSGFGSSFNFYNDHFTFAYKASLGGAVITETVAADMAQFHTFTTYVLAGQVSYFFDNTYLGGGHALTGATNFFLIGDGSAATPSGVGTMYLDHLEIITAVGDNPPTPVPEPAAGALLGGLAALGLSWGVRSRRRAAAQ